MNKVEHEEIHSRDGTVKCRWCSQPIAREASICYHCGRPQVWWKVHHLELASFLGVIAGFALLWLGALEFREARRDRVEAANALASAQSAIEKSNLALAQSKLAEKALKGQEQLVSEFISNSQQVFSNMCRVFGGRFLPQTSICEREDGTAIKFSPPVALLSKEDDQ